jgi:hypothetical protein
MKLNQPSLLARLNVGLSDHAFACDQTMLPNKWVMNDGVILMTTQKTKCCIARPDPISPLKKLIYSKIEIK